MPASAGVWIFAIVRLPPVAYAVCVNRLAPIAWLAVATAVWCGCSRLPAERTVYRVAVKAVEADAALPLGAELASIDQAELYVAKNAARVDIPVTFTDNGRVTSDTYVVWIKRVARTWEFDYLYRLSEKLSDASL